MSTKPGKVTLHEKRPQQRRGKKRTPADRRRSLSGRSAPSTGPRAVLGANSLVVSAGETEKGCTRVSTPRGSQPRTLLMREEGDGRIVEGKDKQDLPVNSPKNFLQTSRRRGRMFSFSSSLVRWMPSSSSVLGRVVSTSPTTCETTSTTRSSAAESKPGTPGCSSRPQPPPSGLSPCSGSESLENWLENSNYHSADTRAKAVLLTVRIHGCPCKEQLLRSCSPLLCTPKPMNM